MTTLSRQLKRLAVPQTQIYQDKKRASFLFEPNDAAGFDKETIFALGNSGFDQLRAIDENFGQFETTLFSESSIGVQRAVLSREANENLSSSIDKFLLHLTPYFPLKAAHKSLEWLIFRFNIHQYNVDAVMRCILPYHDTNLFVRMVQILDINEKNSLWYWLVRIRKPGVPLNRKTILNHLISNLGFLNFVCDTIQNAVNVLNEDELKTVKVLFTFYSSVICGAIFSADNLNEAFVGQLMPNIILGLKSNVVEYILASYMIICQLSLKIKIKNDICNILAKEILLKLKPETILQGLSTVVVLCQNQPVDNFHYKTIVRLVSKEEKLDVVENLEKLNERTNLDQFLKHCLKTLIDCLVEEKIAKSLKKLTSVRKFLNKFIRNLTFDPSVAQFALEYLVETFTSRYENDVENFQSNFGEICSLLFRRYPAIFDSVIRTKFETDDEARRKFVAICDTAGSLIEEVRNEEEKLPSLQQFDDAKEVKKCNVGNDVQLESDIAETSEKLNVYWCIHKDFLSDSLWWPIDDEENCDERAETVGNLLRLFELISIGVNCKTSKSSKRKFLRLMESFIKTYLVTLNDSFKMVLVCLLSERWRYLSCAALNFTLTLLKSIKQNSLKSRLSKDSNVVPCLLIGLSSPIGQIRRLVIQCVEIILKLFGDDDSDEAVEKNGDEFFYMDFLRFVFQYSKEIENDERQINFVVANFRETDTNQTVSPTKSGKRRKSATKTTTVEKNRRPLLFLFVQFTKITDATTLEIGVRGLEIFRSLNDNDFLLAAANSLNNILFKSTDSNFFPYGKESSWKQFFSLTLSKYSPSNANSLTLDELPFQILKKLLSVDFLRTHATECVLKQIDEEFFEALNDDVKEYLFSTLVRLHVECGVAKIDRIGVRTKETLINLPIAAQFLVKFLNENVFGTSTSLRKSKRRRTESEIVSSMDDVLKLSTEKLKLLTFVFEIFLANDKAERGEILLKTFFNCVQIYLDVEDREIAEYGLQLTMHALERICVGTDSSKISAANFDVELLVRCIRTADTSAVHKHAFQLLTVAASLFKENLIIRLMPIFSFMGKNLFRQDDSYSFQIIYRTVDTIIPCLIATSEKQKLEEILLKIYRDFALSAIHIPEHRRLPVLTKLIEASRRSNDDRENNVVTVVRCRYLWLLIGLLIEYYVAHWTKDVTTTDERTELKQRKMDQQNLLHPQIEFCLRLCGEFSPTDQIFCCASLIRYISSLPDELTASFQSTKTSMPEVFELSNHTDKQLRHFKHEILGFVVNLLGSPVFITKLAEFRDEDFDAISGECENLVLQIVQCVHHCQRMTELKSNDLTSKYWKAVLHRSQNCLNKVNVLLSADVALNIITLLLQRDSNEIKQYALEILNGKLTQKPTPFTNKHIHKLSAIVEELTSWLSVSLLQKNYDEIVLTQNALLTLKYLTRVVSAFDPEPFLETLRRTSAILHGWTNVNKLLLSNVVLCLADLVTSLGVKTIPLLPTFISDLLAIIGDETFISENEILLLSCLTTFHKIIESLSMFLSPYLSEILRLLGLKSNVEISNDQYRNQFHHRFDFVRKHLAGVPSRILLPAIQDTIDLDREEIETRHWPFVFEILSTHLTQTDSDDVSKYVPILKNIFTKSLDLRCRVAEKSLQTDVDELEDNVLKSFSNLVLKLSENNFRPFVKDLCEWANENEKPDRLITLYRLTNKLADQLKSLFHLFTGGLVHTTAELISRCSRSKKENETAALFTDSKASRKTNYLLCLMLDFVSKLCQYDASGYITRERFDLLMRPLVDQIDNISVKHYVDRVDENLSPCIINLATAIKDDSAWKVLNYEILLKTRHRKAKVRVCALKIVEKFYEKLGEDISTLAPESVPFLAELMEDESEEVETQCQQVIAVLEKIVGESLKNYF